MINRNKKRRWKWKIDHINRPKSRHGHKCSKCKKCLSMMMFICLKQHLINISSSVHEKVKQRWGWVEKSVVY